MTQKGEYRGSCALVSKTVVKDSKAAQRSSVSVEGVARARYDGRQSGRGRKMREVPACLASGQW